jgi:hypothetical protein
LKYFVEIKNSKRHDRTVDIDTLSGERHENKEFFHGYILALRKFISSTSTYYKNMWCGYYFRHLLVFWWNCLSLRNTIIKKACYWPDHLRNKDKRDPELINASQEIAMDWGRRFSLSALSRNLISVADTSRHFPVYFLKFTRVVHGCKCVIRKFNYHYGSSLQLKIVINNFLIIIFSE